jgi:hypothetical protein
LEKQHRLAERDKETKERSKQFKFPFKWRQKFAQTRRKRFSDQMLVIYFNKKNEIEPPRFMPIFDGNMVIWKNKPYEFDPRAIWKIKGVRGQPMVYCIKEIDRRPIKNPDGQYKKDKYGRRIYTSDAAISNLDVDEIRARGDSTDSDEFLIKAALKAQTTQTKKQVSVIVLVIIFLAIAGGLIWFFTSGGG